MTSSEHTTAAAAIAGGLPAGPRIVAIGSNRLHGFDTSEICAAVGFRLAELPQSILVTGGMPGVGEAVGRSFQIHCWQIGRQANIFHLLPHGSGSWDYGTTLHAGLSMEDRKEILGRLPAVFVTFEGGPGTAHEARVAIHHGAPVLPVGRSGGYSGTLHHILPCPFPDLVQEWTTVDDPTAEIEQVALAVFRIVSKLTNLPKGLNGSVTS